MIIPPFKSKKELFKYILENKDELIQMKKATVKFTDLFGGSTLQTMAIKALNTHFTDDVSTGVIKRTIIGNTYNWMDSHSDVHLKGVFEKSISERQDKIFHLHDHEHKITSKVGTPTSFYEKNVSWADLGVDLAGKTQSLFMDSDIKKSFNEGMFNQYLNKEVIQHSVGMIYVKLDIAINDSELDAPFKLWNKVINRIGNKEKAEKQGFFWAVTEAKLIEISAVLRGSNELTPTVDNKLFVSEENIVKSVPKGINYKSLVDKL